MNKGLTALFLLLLAATASAGTFSAGAPSTTNNDDSCDIALLPAATLFLPYFEVDVNKPSGSGETTLITIANTSTYDAIAHVTLWTDRSFPVISFEVFLTGYDVQSINLYDVIVLGRIAPPNGTGANRSPMGDISRENPSLDLANCDNLPSSINQLYTTRMKRAFTEGVVPATAGNPSCSGIGGVHENAVGYATIDVVSACNGLLPSDPAYWDLLRYDNVLFGDYQQVNGAKNFAQGGPLVHIRAVPEPEGVEKHLVKTFYGRFHSLQQRGRDRRQPLPSLFGARWSHGGTGGANTQFKIWREGLTGVNATCADYAQNGRVLIRETVTFDEEENAAGVAYTPMADPPQPQPVTASAGRYALDDRLLFAPLDNGAISGWMYFNLAEHGSEDPPLQAWVIASMGAEGRYSTDVDALALGNGCTPVQAPSEIAGGGTTPVGPADNVNP